MGSALTTQSRIEDDESATNLRLTPLTPSYAHAVFHFHAVISCERKGLRERRVLQTQNDDDLRKIAYIKGGKPRNATSE
jgi:hypothetical protein